jgi:nuclear GTP-binding protein
MKAIVRAEKIPDPSQYI